MIKFLLAQRWRQAKRYFTGADIGRMVTIFLLGVVGVGVALGVYALIQLGLSAVSDNAFLQRALSFFVYEMFLLVVSGLVFYSVLISSAFSLYRSDHDFWVVASPAFSRLIYDKFITVAGLSLWPVLIIALPALLAVNAVFGIGVVGFLLSFLAVLLLAVASAAVAFCLLLALSHVVHAVCRLGNIGGQFRWFVLSVGLFIAGSATGLWLQFGGVDISTLFAVKNLQLAEAGITQITHLFQIFPSHLAALVVQSVQRNATAFAVQSLMGIGLIAGLSLGVIVYLSRQYIESWKFYQHSQSAIAHSAKGNADKRTPTTFSDQPVASLIRKESLAFVRNSRNQLWALFLVLLWVVTVVFDPFMQSELPGGTLLGVEPIEFIQTFQLLVVVYFVAALSVRFVFPSFSLESEKAWSLLSAPVSLSRLFYSKALFFAVTIGLLAAGIAVVHVLLLGIAGFSALMFILMAIVSAITVTLLGLALGARFPNFHTSNPEVLATTLPGLSYVVVSLLYGSVASYLLYFMFRSNQFGLFFWFVVGSLILVFGCSWWAIKKLPTIEFEAEIS